MQIAIESRMVKAWTDEDWESRELNSEDLMKLAVPTRLFTLASIILATILFPLQNSGYSPSLSTFPQGQRIPFIGDPFGIQRQGISLRWSPVSMPIVVPKLPVRKLSDLDLLKLKVMDGEIGVVRGIYAAGVMALPVVQQPKNEWSFVSTKMGVVTQLQTARHPVTGLLAHNFLEGKQFYNLSLGQELDLVYGDGAIRRYQVSAIYQYQKLNLNSLSGDMIDLSTGQQVTTGYVFNLVYKGSEQLTLQTCLEKDGLSNWGLYFVVARPLTSLMG